MKTLILTLGLIYSFCTFAADDKIKFNYVDAEITQVIQDYAKATGQKFTIDSVVRGKTTILNSESVPVEKAFEELSEALAAQGFAVVKRDEFYTVKTVRYALRDNIQASTDVPVAKPQRLATWMVVLKNVYVGDLVKDLRTAISSEGEMTALRATNQLFITDWSYNLQRVAEMVKQADQPMDPNTAKILSAAIKQVKAESVKTEEAPKDAAPDDATTKETKKSKKAKD